MPNLIIDAKKENLDKVLEFINGELLKFECEEMLLTKIDIAVEEIFVNISSYAYENPGEVEIKCNVFEDSFMAEIELIDSGKPYNPLKRDNPDINLSVDERKIGGLGIFMTKQFMDEVKYRFEDGKNILTIYKKINKGEN